MAARIRRHPALATLVSLIAFAALFGSLLTAPQAAETPRRGGVLLAAIGADAPGLDPHQEQTFATLQPMAPLYSTLLQIDPYSYPNIIGDVASEWKISSDALIYTFKIRPGIRFHDGSPLTAADVKASYDKIIFPPDGVRSIRKHHYSAVASRGGAGSEHRFVQAQVPLGLPPDQSGLAVERHLPQEVPRQGPELLQGQRHGLRPLQVQELYAGLDVRRRAEPRLLRQGPAVPRRLQVLHQHRDVRARRGHPVRAAPTSSSATCPSRKSRPSRSTSATRSSSSRRPSSSTSTWP